MTWRSPLSREQMEASLRDAIAGLHPGHARRFAAIRVPLRLVPVAAHPGESVWVVAECEGRIVYWSDVEDGWAIDPLDEVGGIADRDCNQFELSHVTWQLFGDPEPS